MACILHGNMGVRWVLFGQAGRENGYKNNGSIVQNQNGSESILIYYKGPLFNPE